MPSRRDPRNRKIWFYRKVVRHPITGAKVKLYATGFKSQGEANDAEQKAIDALKAPEKGLVPIFDEWFHGRYWNEWVLGQPRGANSESEQESKRLIYDKHLKPVFGMLPLDRIELPVINTFRAAMRAKRKPDGTRLIKEKTLNNILAVLSTPLQYAVKVGILLRAPHVGVAKVERPEIEFIEFEEVPLLVNAAREDMHAWVVLAVLLAYEAGLRIGEIRALEWETVDMRARAITVVRQVRTVGVPWPEGTPSIYEDGSKRGRYQYVDKIGPPKGRRRRTIPMSPALYAALKDRVRSSFVVAAEAGKMITKEMVRCASERVTKRAGLSERISGWHVGRHTFGTHAALLGVNAWLLQEWMGHTRLEETLRYASVARAHGRTIPSEVRAAGAAEQDPSLRVLCQLSARHAAVRDRNSVAATLQQTEDSSKKR